MRRTPPIFLASLLCLAAAAPAKEPPKAIADSGFVLGVDTYFDFGPPFHYYEIFVVTPAPQGAKVGKFTLMPPAHKCYAPEKTEYVENTTSLSLNELLAGVDPCKIPEKDLKKEQKRKTKESNFSGAIVAMQVTCGGAARTIQTKVLERDWFLAHPGTPKSTSWTTMPGNRASYLPELRFSRVAGPAESGAGGAVSVTGNTGLSSTPGPVSLRSLSRSSIDSQGKMSSVDMSMGSPLFQGAVRDAVKDWKFPPAPPTMDVDDPPRQVTVTLSFKLNCNADAEKQ
jgi:hypothetical protein